MEARIEDGAVVLDVRDPETFALGHVPGAINVGLNGRFAEFAGSVVDPMTPMILCGDTDQVIEARTRLSRIGYDQVVGAFAVESTFHGATVETPRHTVAELRTRLLTDETFTVLDVRNPGELEDGTIEDSLHIPLAELIGRLGELADVNDVVVYCAGGYRSSIAASVLRAVSERIQVSDLVGGFSAWDESN